MLSGKEKDKLLFRLIAKDAALIKRMEFELLEDGETIDERREEIYKAIDKGFATYRFYSPGYLLLVLRSISGDINRHVKTTKDKYGEVQLNFLMLNKSLSLFGDKIRQAHPHKSRTFNAYVVKRSIKLLQLLGKMHEDYILDFQDDMTQLGQHIENQPRMSQLAENLGLDVGRLLRGEV